ncbi:hypothetical protein Tco_1190400 [Tanacetum coccineum]
MNLVYLDLALNQRNGNPKRVFVCPFQTDDLDVFDFDCDDTPSAKAVLMANLSSYDSDVLSEVPFHEKNIENDIFCQSVQETQCSKQPYFDNDTEIDITSDSNILSYEQYLQETKNPVVQSTSSPVQQDELLMSVIEEMSSQVSKSNKEQQENLIVNETLTVELERYKEQVKLVEPRQKFDLNDREKYIYDQLRKVIVDENAKKVPALYDGYTVIKTYDALSITNIEETLELAEESWLKMLAKQNYPSLKEKKVNVAPVDYVALNKLSEHFVKHFVKHFVPQKQLSAEQAFWLPISQPVSKKPPVLSIPVL